jgi:cytochrome P450
MSEDPLRYSPFDPAIFEDPLPIYARLRRESPVHYVEAFDCWALARFEDVWHACQSPDLFTAEQGTTAGHLLQKVVEVFPALDMMDPPRHTAHRALVSGRFGPAAVRRFESELRQIVRDRLAIGRERGRIDVIRELGFHLSTGMVCLLLGLPREDGEQLRQWVEAVFHREPGEIGITQAGLDGFASLDAYSLDLVKARRASGKRSDDVLGLYMAAEIDDATGVPSPGQRMSDDKVASLVKELVVAGTETLPKMLAATLLRLWERPDDRRTVSGSPDHMLDAFMETVRFDMPTQFMARVARRNLEIGGQTIREDQAVLLLYTSASRDENEFPDADAWRWDRRAPRTVGFGHGTHACLGRHAARLEARVALEEILGAFPDYAVDIANAERLYTEYVQGFASLPIVLSGD